LLGCAAILAPENIRYNNCRVRLSAWGERALSKIPLEEFRTVSFGATTRKTDGVTVIDISGSVTLGEASALGEMVHELVHQGRKKIILNLHDVQYLDSSGIGQLVSSYATVKKNGGQLKILYLSKKVQDLLSVTGLYKIFEEFSDEQAAVQSFRQA
jgi:anti-sigma B factor antagonist